MAYGRCQAPSYRDRSLPLASCVAAQAREPAAHVARGIKGSGRPWERSLHRIPDATKRREHIENRDIGSVVTDEHWVAARERRVFYHLAHCLPFVEKGRLDFDHSFAVHHLDVLDAKPFNDCCDPGLERPLQLRRQSIM